MLNFWNDQRITRLKFLWGEGMTCAAIAEDMGAPSRSAIIGKVHRLGLSQRCNKVSAAELERRAEVRNRRAEARAARGMFPGRARPKMQEREPVIKIAVAPFIGSLEIPFAELDAFKAGDANQCRFIAAEIPGPDYLACGNPTLPGESYCGHHHGIVYNRGLNLSDVERARRAKQAAQNWYGAVVKRNGFDTAEESRP